MNALKAVSCFRPLALWAGLLFLGSLPAAAGPLLSDSNLFAALNPNYAGLEQVRTNIAQTNYAAAKTNLAAYLRARTNVTWSFDPHAMTNAVSFNQTQADQSATGRVTVISITYVFPAGDIDWFYNVTKDPNYTYDPNNEWQWQLNRMDFWPNLGATYWGTTQNEYYAQAWVAQLRDWLTSCPVPSTQQNGAGSCWRTIEAGIRMGGGWPNTYHRFLLSPSFTDQDVCDYLKSCIEHARYLRKFPTSGNWLTMEMSGLYTVGALYPELNEAMDWRTNATARLYSEQTNQFYADGVQKELSPGYHGVAIGNILAIYNVAKIEGRLGDLPTNYLAGLEKAYQHYLWLMTPNRKMPQFNDCVGEVDVKSALNTAYSLFTNRNDFLWVASNGASGAPPPVLSRTYPWAGYNVMRSGWATTNNYLCLDAGPLGVGHWHQDKLNVVLWAWGQKILFDSGGGEYETSIWRTYGTAAWSHNTLIVDGQNQAGGDGGMSYTDSDYATQAPDTWRWESDPAHDFAAGIYSRGYGSFTTRPATHTRRVLFVQPDLYLVADTLSTNDASSHTYQARWHLLPTNSVTDLVTKIVTTTQPGQPNLAIVPCLLSNLTVAAVVAQSNASASGLLGWNIIGGAVGYSPCTTVTHQQTGPGTKQFLTLLMPLRAGETNPVTNIVSTGPTSARVELADGRRLLVSADANPARGLKLTEILPDNSTNRLAGGGFTPPAISAIPDQATSPNTPIGPIAFTIGETNLTPANLVVLARSLDTRIVPNTGIVLGGSGSNRFVTVTPAPGRAGAATVMLTVMDPDGATASADFTVNIVAPPAAGYFWDTSTNPGLQPASGAWSGVNANWSATNTGSNPLLPWPAIGNDAFFIGAGSAYAITVSATQNVNNLSFTNGTWTLSGGALNHFAGPMTMTAEGNVTLNLPLTADTDLVKLGAATLTLGSPASFLGNTVVQRGTLQLTADHTLPPTTSLTLGSNAYAAKLDLSTASQELAALTVASTNSAATNLMTVGSGRVLAINGDVTIGVPVTNATTLLQVSGSGALVVNDPGGLVQIAAPIGTVNAPVKATCDLSGLATFACNAGTLNIGAGDNVPGWNSALLLATNSSCTIGSLNIGASSVGGTQTLKLGSGANQLWVDTLNLGVGSIRDSGVLVFNSPSGSLTLSNTAGNGRVIVNVGTGAAGTAYTANNLIDLTGHPVSLFLGTLTLGDQPSRGGTWTQTFSFDQGALDVTNVLMCRNVKAGISGSATLNLAGGLVNIGAGGVSLSACAARGTLNIKGGTVTVGGDITCGPAGAGTVTLNSTNNAVLDLTGHALGSATVPITNFSFLAGTLRNVGQLNGGASPLVKTGAGALTLAGTNGYSGGTVLSNGTLTLAGSLASGLAASGGLLTGSGTVAGGFALNAAATWRAQISGLAPVTDYDQLAITGAGSAITLAGALDLVVTNLLPTSATFTLIRNDSLLPVAGNFAGLPQLATLTNGTRLWRINYAGGDGNDVVLTLLDGGFTLPPVITLLAPTNNATVSAPLTLLANASDPNNDLARVEFYGDGVKLGEIAGAPFTMVWTNLPSGYHSVFARAVDAGGLSAQTPSALVSAGWPSLSVVTNGSDWKYHDLGQNLGTNWRRPDFNDALWPSGPAPLGYADANGLYPRTTNSFGPDSNNKYITTYYRRAFVAPEAPTWSGATLGLQRDDGAIVYLNGLEVFRSNMPTGAVNYLTLASAVVSASAETNWYSTNLSVAPLLPGTNVLAAEIHQNTNNSSDIWFDLRLTAQPTNAPPRLSISLSDGIPVLHWPAWAAGLSPVNSIQMKPPVTWLPMSAITLTITNGEAQVPLPLGPPRRFYRLQSP